MYSKTITSESVGRSRLVLSQQSASAALYRAEDA